MTITTIILWIIYCILTTLIHELGHFVAAYVVGLPADRFQLGVGTRIIYTRGKLQITALPASGQVYFADNRLDSAPVKTQRIIAGAGPTVNLIAGLITLPVIPMFAWLNLLTFAGNLIPLSPRGQKTDGAYIFQGLQKIYTAPASAALATIALLMGYQLIVIL